MQQVDRTRITGDTDRKRSVPSGNVCCIEEFGYEGIKTGKPAQTYQQNADHAVRWRKMKNFLPLLQRYTDMGKYDEVILKYLDGLSDLARLDELLSVWKSAQGFDMDTYEMDEKLLGLLMFTSDYRKEG